MVAIPERTLRAERTGEAMQLLLEAHALVGGEVLSGGGTGTYDLNTWVTEVQAGSYALMDTPYVCPQPRGGAQRVTTATLCCYYKIDV